ncbi:MAG: aspartate--ammonia ligase [Lachnospiraceae bacterium]|nr:aspartate--ammonia ligase [Lachnospiraceae bacterium]MDN4743201.1 aspartate--ammonia ligase [Lachnospiraceae bacterium C1.1]
MSLMELSSKYESKMSIIETEIAIKEVKDYFERALANELNLTRVSAPLYVRPETGLNDNLNGVERPVSFDIKDLGCEVEIVHSLAKWKRYALKKYGFKPGEGLYTDMYAIRRDEDTDNLHSLYVDQWDWERVIEKKDRNPETLKEVVKHVYAAIKKTEDYLAEKYEFLTPILPEDITFVTTQELEDAYPDLTAKEREHEYVKKYGAIFLCQIGDKLASGEPHDGRAPDYDDWKLNGDIIVNYPILDCAFELSSMGIRVDEQSLAEQLKKAGCEERAELEFQKMILNKELPYTIGGGIGQSRICMYFLRKAHIGEVQSSVWKKEDMDKCEAEGIQLL